MFIIKLVCLKQRYDVVAFVSSGKQRQTTITITNEKKEQTTSINFYSPIEAIQRKKKRKIIKPNRLSKPKPKTERKEIREIFFLS